MNHYIPFRIMSAVLIACLSALCICSAPSAKGTISSARQLPFDVWQTVTISAYDTAYFYFQIPTASPQQNTHISFSLSGNNGLSLSVLDAMGTALTLTKNEDTYSLSVRASAGERCFLCIRNTQPEAQRASLRLAQVQPKASPPQATPKKKPTVKSPKPSKAVRQKNTKKPSRKKASSHKSTLPSNPSYATHTPTATQNYNAATPTPDNSPLPYTDSYEAPTGDVDGNESPSTGALLPKTHFLRLQRGTSLSLMERLFDYAMDEPLLIQASSDAVSINDGIIYVPKEGLYYVTITCGERHTTCTILVTTNDGSSHRLPE